MTTGIFKSKINRNNPACVSIMCGMCIHTCLKVNLNRASIGKKYFAHINSEHKNMVDKARKMR